MRADPASRSGVAVRRVAVRRSSATGLARAASAGRRAASAGRRRTGVAENADAWLRELCAARGAAFPVLGPLAEALVGRKVYEALGYRSVGDWSREKLGVGARTVRDQARVWSRLRELPRLRAAVCSGEVSFSVARLVVGVVTPETEEQCLRDVRGRTVRAVEAMVRVAREAAGRAASDPEVPTDEDEARVRVRIACSREESGMWHAAVELARRVSGESLPVWASAEWMVAEAESAVGAAALGIAELDGVASHAAGVRAALGPAERPLGSLFEESAEQRAGGVAQDAQESGLRERAWPGLEWREVRRPLPPKLTALVERLDACGPHEVGRRFRTAIAFLQELDLQIGRLLRQVREAGVHRALGFETFERYVRERADLAPRTARRLAALARLGHLAAPVATAFQKGRLTAMQALAIGRVAGVVGAAGRKEAARWIARARRESLRRLEERVEAVPRTEVDFSAPPEVAIRFLAAVRRVGLARLLAHVIREWVRVGRQFRDYADFERDGYRCTVPGCTARRGLQSHHVWFRSHGGPDVPWNRTTLCPFHHRHGVHGTRAGRVRIAGRAPDALIYWLGGPQGEVWRSGDVRWRGSR